MKVYLAARYTRHPEMQLYAHQLRELGYEITSRWIRGNHEMLPDGESDDTAVIPKHHTHLAHEDFDDVMAADIHINFTEAPRTGPTRGGRHVEFGMAYIDFQTIWVVGHRENIFHCLNRVVFFPTWHDCHTHAELMAQVP